MLNEKNDQTVFGAIRCNFCSYEDAAVIVDDVGYCFACADKRLYAKGTGSLATPCSHADGANDAEGASSCSGLWQAASANLQTMNFPCKCGNIATIQLNGMHLCDGCNAELDAYKAASAIILDVPAPEADCKHKSLGGARCGQCGALICIKCNRCMGCGQENRD